jgi:hypothetical protein
MCARGIRAWLATNGFDVRDAVLNGVPIEDLEKLNDAFAQVACEKARWELDNG